LLIGAATVPGMQTADLSGTNLAYLEDGPADGRPVVLVHGFPDSPHSWSGLRSDLAGAGFRVLAPFQRGYAPSPVPTDGAYATGQLARDIAGFSRALTDRPVVLIGHDWGAMAVYGAAHLLGEDCAQVVAMSVPPGLGAGLFSYAQAKRSFYMFFFQLPVDSAVAADDLAFLDGLWNDWTVPSTDSVAARRAVKDCLRDPEHLAAALGYYRAMFAHPAGADADGAQTASLARPAQPLLYLHGDQDACIDVGLSDHVKGRVVVEGANHFLQLDQPARVSQLVLDALR
jgi:pimeloyl-ACP methyl ester carboxylesterase